MPDCNLEKNSTRCNRICILQVVESAVGMCSVVAVVDEIADEFIDVLVAETKKLKVGDGFHEDNYVGPLIP